MTIKDMGPDLEGTDYLNVLDPVGLNVINPSDWDEDEADEEEEEEEGEEGEEVEEEDGSEEGEEESEDPELVYARSKGYKGREEFDGDDAEFVGYKAFNKNERLYHKISEQAKELQSTRKAVKELREGLQNINKTMAETRKAQLESAKTRLAKQKVQSLKDGEFELAEELDSKLRSIERGIEDEVEEEDVKEEPTYTKEDWDSFHSDWVAGNSWFTQNEVLREAAVTHLKAYVYETPDISPSEAFEKLDRVMNKLIRGTNKKQSAALPAGSAGMKSGGSKTTLKLAPEIRAAIKNMAEALDVPEAELLATYSKVK